MAMAVYRVTLRHDAGKLKAGTSVTIPTSSTADQSTQNIPRALREAGYSDDDWKGANILSSTDWKWELITEDNGAAMKRGKELEKYQLPVHSANNDDDAPKKKSKKKSKKDSDDSEGKGYWGMSRWNPICWIIWIILLPFKIIKGILKLFGIWSIISFFTGGDD